ncbi:hypothetical protein NB640_02285 [Oxalobacter vibrioformis]|uniref:Uncharacterized protein n=1 Tax=Oxalobacter vibrioformis TaxID=933080 RepID=A0A9E9M0Y2_9BURK|nr:hypothetical protein [Oxalobacter vibrioformis]WAW10508.1 hypothetical protein NB640_02285 [Oxalobacter vibrioformis]
MQLYHLRILAHFNNARNELMAAEKILAAMPKHPDDNNHHFELQLSRDVFIEIRRIEYLIRKEIRRREYNKQRK